MLIDTEQKINLLAIEIIEVFGNLAPSQKQIDHVESWLINNKITQTKMLNPTPDKRALVF